MIVRPRVAPPKKSPIIFGANGWVAVAVAGDATGENGAAADCDWGVWPLGVRPSGDG